VYASAKFQLYVPKPLVVTTLQSSNTRKIDLYGVLQVRNYVYKQELIDIPMDHWISVSLDTKDILCKGGSGFVQAIDLKHVLCTTVFPYEAAGIAFL